MNNKCFQTDFVFHSLHSHKNILKIRLPLWALQCHYPLRGPSGLEPKKIGDILEVIKGKLLYII